MNFETIIGLEIHVELNTKTKAYCSCANEFGAQVNSNCCPVCLGLPGALPVLNKEVVERAVRVGIAIGSKINRLSKQDRKNYFYPDTSKAYQISQFDIPLCSGGKVDYIADNAGTLKTVCIERIQIEEDAGKMLHNDSFDGTLIDYNRCGVPLIEVVTKPDLRSGEEVKAFLENLRAILIDLGVTDGKMQEGSIRCDVNVSVRPEGSDKFGTRVEMKNVNTFSGAARAVEYETKRQIELINAGGKVEQETRRWDDIAGVNEVLRTKEDATDYRYFPDPDLKAINITDQMLKDAGKELPELPHIKILKLMKDYNLSLQDANILIDQNDKGELFSQSVAIGGVKGSNIANWILGDITRNLSEDKKTLAETALTPAKLVDMIKLIEAGKISTAAGKTVVKEIMYSDKSPEEVVAEKNLEQIQDDSALESIVKQVIEQNPQTIEQYKSGKTNVLGFLVGQCMKASKGQGNPVIFNEIILKIIQHN